MSDQAYQCLKCRRRVEAAEKAPQCCGQAMAASAPLDQCTLTSTPEHSRLEDPGEPCDDGRAG